MDYTPEERSIFLKAHKDTLSPGALSTIQVMAFLDPICIQNGLFDPLRRLFTSKNKDLNFNFPATAAAHKEACAELVEASLIQFSKSDKSFVMKPEIQNSVMADLQTAGLITPLFNGTVKVLTGLWPQMICVPDRTVDQEEYKAATAPGTNYEAYLKKRYTESRLPPFQEYGKYANRNVWGQRDELVHHIGRLEQIFYHFDDDMIEVCATVTFVMLLTEASWYYFERSRYHEAEVKIESALGVYQLGRARSSLHSASIYRVHAAIALESGKVDDAARYVNAQVELLELHYTAQGDALKKSGLLDRAPDAMYSSSWGLDAPPGKFVVLPFRSVRNFGFKLYLCAQEEKDQQYPVYLGQAERCFSAALKDCLNAHTKTARIYSRLGELHYALGNVAKKQVSFLGKAHLYTSFDCYENALLQFQRANTDNIHKTPSIAKTHYKLAMQFIQLKEYDNAIHHIDEATQFYAGNTPYKPHLARLFFQRHRIQTLTGGSGAKSFLHSAFSIRLAILGGVKRDEKRSAKEMTEADFDELVGIWER